MRSEFGFGIGDLLLLAYPSIVRLLHLTTSCFFLLTVQYLLSNRIFHAVVDIRGLLQTSPRFLFSIFVLCSIAAQMSEG
ncbi:hypothetical protein BDW69DRAFT_136360 [Aspergillus filifer]